MAEAVTDPAELCRLLKLPATLAKDARRAADTFRLLVPRPYLDRIRPGDPDDPLLRQVLPISAESQTVEGFTQDPLGEAAASTLPGLLSKYRGRSLIVTTGRCAVHCRFCFRRHSTTPTFMGNYALQQVLHHLDRNPAIHEVILSGGDPLVLDDRVMAQIAQQISELAHVRRLRLHTRMPIVVPQRITQDMMEWIRQSRLMVAIVLHVNHPAEIDPAVAAAVTRLADDGIPLLSQTVLLRGVNDHCEVLAKLFERLIDLRIKPYYLHQLDRVAGAAHFEVPLGQGLQLVQGLRDRLPGYAIPRYVRDIPGNRSKQILA